MIKIELTPTLADLFFSSAFNAGRAVGTKEAKRANVFYTLGQDAEPTLVTTFGNTLPSPFSILIASIRYSVSKQEYVTSVNAFVRDVEGEIFVQEATKGLTEGLAAVADAPEPPAAIFSILLPEGFKNYYLSEELAQSAAGPDGSVEVIPVDDPLVEQVLGAAGMTIEGGFVYAVLASKEAI